MPVRALAVLLAGTLLACTSSAEPEQRASPPQSLAAPQSITARQSVSPADTSSSSVAPATPSAPTESTRHPAPTPTRAPPGNPENRRPQLPLRLPTGTARQVVTVVAGATTDTRGTLQPWRKVPGGWLRVGPAVAAWLGSDGMTARPSEQISAVPMGSYSLTQAFGRDADPGTALPYVQTTPADWWISETGPLYNTLQRCAAECPFTLGAPNEHLYYETPFYDFAVVIDYNRDPVRQGAGSAFFLHVAVGAPTAGCVSIEQSHLVRIMRWLDPARHPRILIGTR
jgi:L,D-peptidoglycan transpeptidase YkuD (ErfK/YbiS/YcfS/YnhG family)